jgi:hypothetical protein
MIFGDDIANPMIRIDTRAIWFRFTLLTPLDENVRPYTEYRGCELGPHRSPLLHG